MNTNAHKNWIGIASKARRLGWESGYIDLAIIETLKIDFKKFPERKQPDRQPTVALAKVNEKKETPMITVSTKLLKAILQFASKDVTRPHMCGIYFDGVDLVATDGHTLVRARVAGADPNYTPILVPTVAIKQACAVAGAKGFVSLHGDTLTADGTAISVNRNGDKFPAWLQVIPRDGAVKSVVGFNADYIARLAPLAEAVRGKGSVEPFALTSATGELDPIRFDLQSAIADITVVIMPVRLDAKKAA